MGTLEFRRLQRNPTDQLKVKLNKLISAANAVAGDVKFERIVGEFGPGYFYGNIKSHKEGCPIRPIISQIPSPTYGLAKRLNSLISPFIPTGHSLKSADEFLEVLSVRTRRGLLASLDVQSLFTNVPVEDTIEIILDYVYHHPDLPPLQIPREILKRMLSLCTKESPFRCPEGNLYLQCDGVAMGSPLGVLFAQAYMSHVEGKVMQIIPAPFIYCRYIDDVFVDIQDEAHLATLKTELERNSVLKFTVDKSIDSKMPFLDVDVDGSGGSFITQVYRKQTNTGHCLNGRSECPARYKTSVIRAYVRRALKTCSTWELIHQELERLKQIFANNGYDQNAVEQEIRRMLDTRLVQEQGPSADGTTGTTHKLWYKGTMSSSYKTDEKILRSIVSRNCIPANANDKITLNVFYQSPRVSGLVMKNNLSCVPSLLRSTNVVYKFKCTLGDCARLPNSTYIGHTSTTVSRRITMHLQEGGPLRHLDRCHNVPLTRDMMVCNTSILARCSDKRRLQILEAVYIRDMDPIINRQLNMRGALTLFDSAPLAARAE